MRLRRNFLPNQNIAGDAKRRDRLGRPGPAACDASAIRSRGNQVRRKGRRTVASYRFAASPTVERAMALLSFSDLLKGRMQNRQPIEVVPKISDSSLLVTDTNPFTATKSTFRVVAWTSLRAQGGASPYDDKLV